jgi:outer membrane protein assembly factor BamB
MKRGSGNSIAVITAVFAFVNLMMSCTTHNWPQFRGAESNMVATGQNLPDIWSNGSGLRWTCHLTGNGYSSPVVWGDKVFISSAFAEKDISGAKQAMMPPPSPRGNRPGPGQNPPPQANRDDRPAPGLNPPQQAGQGQRPASGQNLPPQAGQGRGQNPPPQGMTPEDDKSYLEDIYRWEVTCLDLQTGTELWKQVAYHGHPRIKKQPMNTYANETPVTDGKRVYVYFGMTGVFCYDMNGKPVWQKDLGAYETEKGWGTGSSPVLYNDILYIKVDNDTASFIVALDAATGEQKWKAVRDEKTSYSSPVIWKNRARTELVTAGKTARSYDPASGKVIWELKMGGEMSIPSPVADKDHLYIGIQGGRETPGILFAVKAGAEGDITPAAGETKSNGVDWVSKDAGLANPSPLLYKGLIYNLGGRGGEINCIDASSGEKVYKEKIDSVAGCWASPWAMQDRIYLLDEKGVTHVIKAGNKPEVIARNKLNDKFWASVAITGDAYILRGVENLYCIGK